MKAILSLAITIIGCNSWAQYICETPDISANTIQAESFNLMVEQYKNQGFHLNQDLKVIPTLIHVIYRSTNDSAQIDLQRVKGQIEAANLHLMRKNKDTGQTRSIFKNAAAVCNIRVCLARRLPDGSTTSGLLYHNVPFFDKSKNLDSVKMATIIDPDRYMNVWVLPEQGGGSAIWPWIKSSQNDGFYVGAYWFGTQGNNLSADMNEGSTFVHELAHYLGVYHTFHGSSSYLGNCTLINNDTIGDWCGDTPLDWNIPLAVEQCDTGRRACSNSNLFTAQTENFMYYNRDSCTNMFSKDQRARMRACLDSLRPVLTSEANLDSTGIQCLSVDIPEKVKFKELGLSPNPVLSHCKITGVIAGGKTVQIRILNLSGARITDLKLQPSDTNFEVSFLNRGVYVALIQQGDRLKKLKFVKL